MSNFIRKYKLYTAAIIALIPLTILLLVYDHLAGLQMSQNEAKRWAPDGAASQVSVFISTNTYVDQMTILSFEHSIDSALIEAGEAVDETGNVRSYLDTYSAKGSVTVSSGRSSGTYNALGVEGDFFAFHPQELVSGGYFSDRDINNDYCVIDEDISWQLFGSSDVVGQMIYIQDKPLIIAGVVRRDSSSLAKKAGLKDPLIYLSMSVLEEWGVSYGISHYEIVMANPVTGFVQSHVEKNIGIDEKSMEIVENSSRYSFVNIGKTILEFGTRSMNSNGIIYPYWENIARAYEDILTLMLVFIVLLMLIPVIAIIVFLKRNWSSMVNGVKLFFCNIPKWLGKIRVKAKNN